MRWLIFIQVLILSGCSTFGDFQLQKTDANTLSQLVVPYDRNLFEGENLSVESIDEIFYLTESQKKDFWTYFNNPRNRDVYPNHRISRYLSSKLGTFNFYSDTLTASQALSNQLGNCLSLAIVTHALADLAGVTVKYELVKTPAIFQKEGDVVLASQHVQSLLYDPGPGEFNGKGPIWRSYIRVDYYPTGDTEPLRRVPTDEFFSMFYRNRAAEAIGAGRLSKAYAYLTEVLSRNKTDGQAINSMAVLHERMGEKEKARELYLFGLQYGEKSAEFDLLYNYHILLKTTGQAEELAIVEERLNRYKDKNPFRWVSKGEQALVSKNYRAAIRYFQKASKLASYLHEPYAGIAKAQAALGNAKAAKRALRKAIEKSRKAETKNLYQLKYETLVKLD